METFKYLSSATILRLEQSDRVFIVPTTLPTLLDSQKVRSGKGDLSQNVSTLPIGLGESSSSPNASCGTQVFLDPRGSNSQSTGYMPQTQPSTPFTGPNSPATVPPTPLLPPLPILEWSSDKRMFIPSSRPELSLAQRQTDSLGAAMRAKTLECKGIFGVIDIGQASFMIVVSSVAVAAEGLPHLGTVYSIGSLKLVELPYRKSSTHSGQTPKLGSSDNPSSHRKREVLDQATISRYRATLERFCAKGDYCSGHSLYLCYSANIVTRLGASAVATSAGSSPSLKPSSSAAGASPTHSDDQANTEDLPRTAVFRWNGWFMRRAFDTNIRFVVPVIRGYVGKAQVDDVGVALICRLSVRRAGTRYNRRGLDGFGHAANFSETEQVVWKGSAVTSFLSVRGSVPVKWSQPSDLRRIPCIELPPDVDSEDIARHLRILSRLYEGVRFSFLDLLGSKAEQVLSNRFKETVETHNTEAKKVAGPDSAVFHQVSYTRFDLNGALKRKEPDPLAPIITSLLGEDEPKHSSSSSDSLPIYPQRFSHWVSTAEGRHTHSQQKAIVRINCLDCIDRTNIAQFRLGMQILTGQLEVLGVSAAEQRSKIQYLLRCLWVQLGNHLSYLYTGTEAHGAAIINPVAEEGPWGAQAGQYIRLRTAARRWINNNFFDGAKQDIITLISGDHSPSAAMIGEQPIYKGLTLNVLAVAAAYAVCCIAMFINLMVFIADGHTTTSLIAMEAGWLALLASLVMLTVSRGGRAVSISPVLPESRRYL